METLHQLFSLWSKWPYVSFRITQINSFHSTYSIVLPSAKEIMNPPENSGTFSPPSLISSVDLKTTGADRDYENTKG